MTGAEFKAIRKRLGLSRAAFGYVLGYQGKAMNVNTLIWQMERDKKRIMPWTGRLAEMYSQHGIPCEWMPPADIWRNDD